MHEDRADAFGTDGRLAPLYDAARAMLAREGRWRAALVNQVAPEPHDVILDIGCGAGSLAMLLVRAQPAAEVIGFDPRPGMLAQARARAAEQGLAISFVECAPRDVSLHLGARTPTKIVLSLTAVRGATVKLAQIQGARQMIDPAGVLHVIDYGAQRSALMRRLFAAPRDGAPEGHAPTLIRAAGFVAVEETATWSTPSGAISLYRARAS